MSLAEVDAPVHRQSGVHGHYGNTSEFIRDLERRDQEEQAKKRLCDLIEEGLSSGPGRRRTEADERDYWRSLAAKSIETVGSAS